MIFTRILAAEIRKLRHSRVTWSTWIAYSLICMMAGSLFWIIQNPGMAEKLGLLGQKANLSVARADWTSFAAFLVQMSGIGGILLCSIIVSFVFGREYAEGTAKNMLSLPVGRHWFVAAKLAVSALWFIALSASLLVEGLVIGRLLGLEGFSASLFAATCVQVLIVAAALLALAPAPAVAWVAIASAGIMAPMGFTIFMLVAGTIIGHTDWSRWFPWSIVPLMTGIAGPRVEQLSSGSYLVLAATFACGLAGAIVHQALADNTQ